MPDLQTANRFISGSYDKYTTCISSYEIVTTATSAVSTQAGAATGLVTQFVGSLPQQVMSGLTLAVGLVLMVYGYKLVRPVNFAAGAYLGWTASLILLTIFAPTLASCPAVLAVGTCSGLLVGLLLGLISFVNHAWDTLAALGEGAEGGGPAPPPNSTVL